MPAELVPRLRHALTEAMRARDGAAVAGLRGVLAAVANAESLPAEPSAGSAPATSEHVAGAVQGLRGGEAPRRALTPDDVERIVRAEIDALLVAAAHAADVGHPDRAERLRAEAAAVARVVDASS